MLHISLDQGWFGSEKVSVKQIWDATLHAAGEADMLYPSALTRSCLFQVAWAG